MEDNSCISRKLWYVIATMTTELEVKKRADSADATRKAGFVPGVVYGPKQEPVSIAIDKMTFEKTLHEAGESTIISLKGLDSDVEVLIHDVAFDAGRGGVEHVDFYAIERGKELTTNVSLEFVGEAPVEKSGASVNKVLHEVEVTCRPSVLPSHIEVDVTSLVDEEAQILVSDLVLPEGVKVEDDPEQVVASVAAAREEESDEAPEAVDMDAVAVEEKGKGEEEAAE